MEFAACAYAACKRGNERMRLRTCRGACNRPKQGTGAQSAHAHFNVDVLAFQIDYVSPPKRITRQAHPTFRRCMPARTRLSIAQTSSFT